MGAFTSLLIRALGEDKGRRVADHYRWKVDIDSYGYADLEIAVGDIDGSGEAPGVQLEFEHIGSAGRQAVAMSAHEAELVGRALIQAAQTIPPSDRLKTRTVKWHRTTDGDSVSRQPKRTPPPGDEPPTEEIPF